jgi:phage-related protein
MDNELEEAWKRLESSMSGLTNAIEDAANSSLAEWVGLSETIRSLGGQLVDLVTGFSNDVRKLVLVVHHAKDLRLQAGTWDRIHRQAGELNGRLTDHDAGIRAHNRFEGLAGLAYREAVGKQIDAVKGMGDGALKASGMLNTVASALDSACNSAAAATTAAVVAVTGVIWGVASAASIVGALSGAIAAVGRASTVTWQIENALAAVSSAQSDQAKALEASLDAQGPQPKSPIQDYDDWRAWRAL